MPAAPSASSSTAVPPLASAAGLLRGLARRLVRASLRRTCAPLFRGRSFIIQHGCGHDSYFRSGRITTAVERMLGVITLMQYAPGGTTMRFITVPAISPEA